MKQSQQKCTVKKMPFRKELTSKCVGTTGGVVSRDDDLHVQDDVEPSVNLPASSVESSEAIS